MSPSIRAMLAALALLLAAAVLPPVGRAVPPIIESRGALPSYLFDRGTGTRTSMFGTYVRGGELLVYTFFEYYTNKDNEYAPDELGYVGTTDFAAPFTQTEYLIFIAYGITDHFAIEIESALYTEATQEKAAGDISAMPASLSESGTGDTQIQFDWDFSPETANGAGYFTFLEIVFPLQEDKVLIGTSDWEYKVGLGFINGFSWGTLTGRVSVEYDAAESKSGPGEYAVEYLKRVSDGFRAYLGVEGTEDEIELITELQFALASNTLFKFNNAFGLTPKAADWAPEIGIMWSF